jgi:hypothetical protein
VRVEDGIKGGAITPIELEGLSNDDIEALAELCRADLYIMAKAVLGYKDLTPRTHGAFCEWLVDRTKPRKLGLMPRGHLKTTLATISNPIRCLANDPQEQILIINESSENAEDMLGEIKGHFTSNPTFRAVFSKLIPESFGRQWRTDSIIVPRTGSHRHPSIVAAGINTKLTSRHHTRAIGDDLIAEAAMNSPSVMANAIRFVDRLPSLLVNQPTDPIEIIGTRWAFSDIYSYIIDHYDDFDVFIRKAIVHGPEEAEPLYPEKFTMDYFAGIIKRNPDQWATQFANDPLDTSAVDFKPEWLQYFIFTKDRDIYYQSDDGIRMVQPVSELNVYIHVDPSIGEDPHHDYTGITVVGLSPFKQVFLLDAWAGRIDAVKTTNKILDMAEFWWPKRVMIETNAYQKSLQQYVEEEARRRERFIRIEGYNAPPTKRKPARIRGALGPLFSSRRIWIREGLLDFVNEYLAFGRSEHQHLMDSMAQGPESGIWRYPAHQLAVQRRRRMIEETTPQLGVTGYGA